MTKETKFTWADLKKAVNEMPEDQLNNEVIVWQDESGFRIVGVNVLPEDYVFDGEEGCAPKSVMKKSCDIDELEDFDEDYPVVHTKGTRILEAA